MTWQVPEGFIPNLLTPLHDDYEIDENTLRKLVEFHCGMPYQSHLYTGSNLAEPHNLSSDERKCVTEIIVDQAAGRVDVVASVSSSSLAESLELVQAAEQAGAKAIYAVPPYNWTLTDDQLLDFFVTLSKSTSLALKAYHIPSWQSGAGLSPDFIGRLLEKVDNFVGIKDASFNLHYFCQLAAVVAAQDKPFQISTSLEWFVPAMPLGARSAHTAIASIAPNLSQELFRTASQGDWDAARSALIKFGRIWAIIYPDFPNSLKAAMDMMDRAVGPMRPPQEPLSGSAVQAIREKLSALEFLEDEPRGWDAPWSAAAKSTEDA